MPWRLKCLTINILTRLPISQELPTQDSNQIVDSAIFVPAGIWHNIVNTSDIPLKLYSIYAPPHHPWGTVHQTKAIAEANTNHY